MDKEKKKFNSFSKVVKVMVYRSFSFFIALFFMATLFAREGEVTEKILICGVCRNVEKAVSNDIENIEKLGACFADYAVVICEDNSTDCTVQEFARWAQKNPKVIFSSENYVDNSLCREEKVARARNKVLSIIREKRFESYPFVVMVDLDFLEDWPINEIVKTVQSKGDWDCVSANGLFQKGYYYDRYALRSLDFPLGPELINEGFWGFYSDNYMILSPQDAKWKSVFSAFGGLAIYKRESILSSTYSGKVTEELLLYYKQIIPQSKRSNRMIKSYLRRIGYSKKELSHVPVIWDKPICCEHLPLHAQMALKGFGRFYINPAMVMKYPDS